MKRICFFCGLITVCMDLSALPWLGSAVDDYQQATSKGAKTKIELRVVDDDGFPVSNADVDVNFALGVDFRSGQFRTDADGVAVVEGVTTGNTVEFFVNKESYYNSYLKLRYLKFGENRKVSDGRWQPWGEVRKIKLRKIANAKTISCCNGHLDVPLTNVWLGLDVKCGDWVKPYGKGVFADFELLVLWDCMPKPSSKDCTLAIRMCDENSGGIFADKVIESEFPYTRLARTNDVFSVMTFGWKEREGGVLMREQSYWKHRDFVFRTRCVKDKEGRIIESHYGCFRKLEVSPGDDKHPVLRIHSVFNPTPNDPNLEDAETANRTYKQLEYKRREKARLGK